MAAPKPLPFVTQLATKPPEPPPELGNSGSALWRSILCEWTLDSAGQLAILREACVSCDLADRLRRQIAADGDMVPTANGGAKANPLIMAQISAQSLMARLLAKLDVLDAEPKRPPGRPPKPGGW